MLVANSLDRTPGDLEDASAILGGKAWDTARRITIPLALPAMLAGALVAFLQAMTLFGSPAILAMPAGFHTMTTKIWSLFQFPPKPELAAAASLPLLILTIILLRAEHMVLGRRGYSVVGGKNSEPRIVRLGGWRWVLLAGAMLVLMCPVFLPYFALLNASFSKVASHLVWFNNFTLQNLHFVFYELSATQLALTQYLHPRNVGGDGWDHPRGGDLLRHSPPGGRRSSHARVSCHCAGCHSRHRARRRAVLHLYAAALRALRHVVDLLIAFVTLSLPAAYQQMQSALHAVHPELEDASRILGATRLRSLWQITAPLLRTSVIATWCFVFVGVIRELSAAIMLFTSETKVLSVLIYDLNESGDLAAIAVLGLLMLVITFVVVALA